MFDPLKCVECGGIATVHVTENRGGTKVEQHLCLDCARKLSGLPASISESLNKFIDKHEGDTKHTP